MDTLPKGMTIEEIVKHVKANLKRKERRNAHQKGEAYKEMARERAKEYYALNREVILAKAKERYAAANAPPAAVA